ncbi:MAG: EamA family transporter RarD, partial [Geobacter sp.]|nr:EamA family transporter RarD [Geobacter sp.]
MSGNNCKAPSTGLLFGICSYLIWGFFPIYFRAMDLVPPPQVVAHRIVWAAFFLVILTTVRRGWGDIRTALTTRGSLLLLVTTALLIATNWLVFIIAVGHGEILQSSLGYFITPFVSVILGMTVLKERLRTMQTAALLLALVGVLLITLQQSGIPWAALTLAMTFGTYG